ncbi:MAG: carboxypeptidase regulatory-like domain-containing protein [Candidatus Acidiferrales bacterium]
MNRNATKSLLLGSILVLLLSTPVHAQVAGASLSGTITDASGGAIAGAKISVRNVATNVTVGTTTNTSGFYTMPNLIPADYEVAISAEGFSTAVSKLTLTVGKQQELSVSLNVGRVTEEVTVTGAAPAVETTNSTISAEVDSTTVRELPLNGRDWASLATLQPGVAGVRTQEVITQVGSHARGLGSQLSIDGNRPTQNTYRLNGVIINDYSNAGPGNVLGGNLGVDAIQEFSVLTSNYSAEYGFTSGGVVNAITKSGTNQVHGTAFEFIRNSALDASNFFENASGLPRAPFRRNQFGGSLGGPIKKDKIFIFGAYEGLRQAKGIPHSTKTPTAAARVGNAQPYLTFFPLPTQPLIGAGGVVDPNIGIYAFSGNQVVPDNFYNTRGDVKLSDKDSLNASYYYDRSTFTQPDAFNQVLDQFIVGRQGASLEESHVFSSSMANTARLGYNRTYGFGQLTPKAINPNAAVSSPTFSIEPGLFAARIAGIGGGPGAPEFNQAFTGGLNGNAVEDFTHQTVQTYDDAARNLGTHNLKFGFMFIRMEEKLFAPFTSNGTAQFNSLADFLQDKPFKVQSPPVGGIKTVSPFYTFTSIVAGYLQDDWKMRSNLTVNLGLRYEMETIPSEKHGRIANLPTLTTNPSPTATQGCSTCSTKTFARNPTLRNFEPRVGFAWDPFHNGKTSVRGGFGIFDALPLPYELALNNAQTSPFHVNITVQGCAFTSPPNTQPCIGQGQFPNVPPNVFSLFTSTNHATIPTNSQSWNFVQPNIKRNYVYQWNLDVQRQLAGNLSLTVAYAGSRGKHNPFQTDELNTVFPTLLPGSGVNWIFPVVPSTKGPSPVVCSSPNAPPGSCGNVTTPPGPQRNSIVPGLLINPNVAELQSTIWQSMSWYDSLQVEVEKRMSHGFQVQASFTWSKTEDTSSGSFAGDNFAGDVLPTIPWWDLRLIKGLSDFNVGRNLVVNALWQVPTPASFAGPVGWIARGWELGGILSLSDGVPVWPFSVTGDPMGQLDSEPLAIPDPVSGCKLVNPSSGRHGSLQYINPNCLINAVAPTNVPGFNSTTQCDQAFLSNPAVPRNTCINVLGHLGRNTITGPGLINLDYSMVKNNHIPRISEAFNIQFRAEFFNILNRANFAPPVDNLTPFDGAGNQVGGFGQLTKTQSPERQIQFALKINF